ncbi:MAG: outer membrane protein assembly factor BamA [Elusimicrobia bacterium]|nr:outer membrane protein assembly factor BamA [Elusimicrobiota bacterium]
MRHVLSLALAWAALSWTAASAFAAPAPSASPPAGQAQAPSPSTATATIRVAAVTLDGAKAVDPQEVVLTLRNRPGQPFSEKDIMADILRIERFYSEHGQPPVSVRAPSLSYGQGRLRVSLTYPVVEGPSPAQPPAASTGAATTSVSTAPAPSPVLPVSSQTAAQLLNDSAGDIPPPWVVGDFEVKGTRNIKPSAVKAAIKVRKGDLYDRPDMDRDRQNIYALGSFARVAVDLAPTGRPVPANLVSVAGASTTVKLTFIVEEKPLIKKIKFQGNKKVSKGTLSDVLSLKSQDPLDEVKLREDVDKIIEKYREKGFLAAKASFRREPDTATWHEDIVFLLDEGPRSRIELVTLDGIHDFKPRKILKQLRNKRKKTFAESEIPEDIKKIEKFYLKYGYLDVVVATPTVTYSDDQTKIFIKYPLTEGRAYKFGDSTFSGNIIYTSTQLVRGLDYRKGKVFDHERYEETVRNIQEAYAEVGRLKMRVTPRKTLNPATGFMDVEYQIAEGNIIYVDYVDIEGYKATKRHVIAREILVKPGEAFARSKVMASRERILNLGFIDDVGVDFQESPTDPEKVGMIFDIQEGKPGLLTAGMAYSSTDGLIGTLSLSHLNLFGRAQRTNVQWQFGGRVNDYSISWWTPWILNKPTSLGIDLFNTRRVMPFSVVSNAYVRKQMGGSVNVGPRFKDGRYILTLTYGYKQVTYSNIDSRFRGFIGEGSYVNSGGGISFARETRDNYWDPARGSRHALSLNMTGGPFGGDVHLFNPTLYNASHYRLFSIEEWPFVLSFYNRLTYVTQFGPTKYVPIDERFFIGGQDSLRGYSPDGEAGAPQGGRVREVFNIEFGFPLAREKRKSIVKLVFFFDAGNTWYNTKDVRLRVGPALNEIKTNVGAGIRFVTPAFPIRLDYGYGFNHKPGEKLYQINFGIGNLF